MPAARLKVNQVVSVKERKKGTPIYDVMLFAKITCCSPEPSVLDGGLKRGVVTPVEVALPPRRPNEALPALLHLVRNELMLLSGV